MKYLGLRANDLALSFCALLLGVLVYGLRGEGLGQHEMVALVLGPVPSFLFMIALGSALLASSTSSGERIVMLAVATGVALTLEWFQSGQMVTPHLDPFAWGTFDLADIAAILLASALLTGVAAVRARP